MIKQIPMQFEVDGFPKYADIGGSLYEMARINRISAPEGKGALVVVYREK